MPARKAVRRSLAAVALALAVGIGAAAQEPGAAPAAPSPQPGAPHLDHRGAGGHAADSARQQRDPDGRGGAPDRVPPFADAERAETDRQTAQQPDNRARSENRDLWDRLGEKLSKADANWTIAFLTLGLLVVAAVQAGVYWAQKNIMRDQLRAMERAADAVKAAAESARASEAQAKNALASVRISADQAAIMAGQRDISREQTAIQRTLATMEGPALFVHAVDPAEFKQFEGAGPDGRPCVQACRLKVWSTSVSGHRTQPYCAHIPWRGPAVSGTAAPEA